MEIFFTKIFHTPKTFFFLKITLVRVIDKWNAQSYVAEACEFEWACEAIALWIPPASPWFTWFQVQGFGLRPTPWQRVVRSFDRRIDVEFAQAGWWYQLGDSDLV